MQQTPQISLEDILLRELPVPKGQMGCGFTQKRFLEFSRSERQKTEWWVPGARGGEVGRVY
jgi:hypothetical protein